MRYRSAPRRLSPICRDPQQRELVEEGPEAVTEYARLSREPEPVILTASSLQC